MSMTTAREALAANLAQVEMRIQTACARVGRPRSEVTLVAVTKRVSAATAALLPDLGVVDLGENRPQELWRKADQLPTTVRWHLIGHLQRNKIDRTLPLVHRIHSVDSVRLLEALDAAAGQRRAEAFLEFNCSGERSKNGFAPTELNELIAPLRALKQVVIVGLMTMAALEEEPERARPAFVRLRQLREELRERVGDLHPVDELSMGMSNDYEVAIEEGATVVRLGTVLFAGVPCEEGP